MLLDSFLISENRFRQSYSFLNLENICFFFQLFLTILPNSKSLPHYFFVYEIDLVQFDMLECIKQFVLNIWQTQLNLQAIVSNLQLVGFGLTENDLCAFCKRASETVLHFFLYLCSGAKVLG